MSEPQNLLPHSSLRGLFRAGSITMVAATLLLGCTGPDVATTAATSLHGPATAGVAPSTTHDSPQRTIEPIEHVGWADGPLALDSALLRKEPVLLYMSSAWCPPCRALEANLLSTQAFRDATSGMARVRIDGDSEGAQAIAEKFDANAYPTLILLDSEGDELFRAHHAIRLEELTTALASVKARGQRFRTLAQRLALEPPSSRNGNPASLSVSALDCGLLSAADWGDGAALRLRSEDTFTAISNAFQSCRSAPFEVQASLAAQAISLASGANFAADSALPGNALLPLATVLLDAVFKNDDTVWAARTLITTWVKPVFAWLSLEKNSPSFVSLRDRFLNAAEVIRNRPNVPLDVLLLTYNPMVDLHHLAAGNAPLPEETRSRIAKEVERVVALAEEPALRHALLGNAAYLLRTIGQKENARALLEKEISRTSDPSHYLTTLSQWALVDGDVVAARQFARAAVTRAKGRTSQLQWLVNEVSMFAETAGNQPDSAIFVQRVTEVYALLFAKNDAFSGRNRVRANQLLASLLKHRHLPEVKAIATKFSPQCQGLPEASRSLCKAHFAELFSPIP